MILEGKLSGIEVLHSRTMKRKGLGTE